jgi:dsRNA-specific ribonuclease
MTTTQISFPETVSDWTPYILNEKNIEITQKYIEDMLKSYNIIHTVKHLSNFQRAMTHFSYLDRDRSYYKNNKISKYFFGKDIIDPINISKKCISLQTESYERLEFKGDAVIHHILADYLYNRYSTQDEGFMTKLRTKIENSQTLANFTKVIKLDKYILISKHMEKGDSRENNYHILEDAFESFIGALSMETTYETCYKFFEKLIETEIDFGELLHTENNFKDILLQFFHQKKFHDPNYGVLDISYPNQKKMFTIYVKCKKKPSDEGEIVGVGTGSSKKKGEQEAAYQALKYFEVIKASEEDSDCETFSDMSDCDINDLEILDDEEAENKNYKLLSKFDSQCIDNNL